MSAPVRRASGVEIATTRPTVAYLIVVDVRPRDRLDDPRVIDTFAWAPGTSSKHSRTALIAHEAGTRNASRTIDGRSGGRPGRLGRA